MQSWLTDTFLVWCTYSVSPGLGVPSYGMASPANTVWEPVNANDWTYGVISHNSDFDPNSAACVIPPADSQDPDNDFQVTYSCNKGDDSMVVATEPDTGDPCAFQLTVDSSVDIRSLQGSSSTGPAVISSSSVCVEYRNQ